MTGGTVQGGARASFTAGRRIREARQRRGLSAAALAGQCTSLGASGITATVITNLETGRRPSREITVDELLLLAWVLKVSPLSLFVPLGPDEALALTRELRLSADEAVAWLRYNPCAGCGDQPPSGFTCNKCGRSGS